MSATQSWCGPSAVNCRSTKSGRVSGSPVGLVVIGVHTPEFAFEKRPANVKKALGDLKIDYPVAIDNNYAIWRAFNNQYWPAHYFIDAEGRIRHLAGRFDPAWLDDAWLTVAATDDREANAAVSQAAGERRLFCNVVDDPELSSFQVPSIVDRSPLIVAISSSGVAPVLARRLRERIESLFDHTLGQLAALAARYRKPIRASHPDLGARRRFYDWLLDGPVAGLLRQQQPVQAEAALTAALAAPIAPAAGSVALVGAGPGDPGLLTLKALRALNEADVILYDRLVSDEVMSLARRDAERVAVGKQPGEDHHATQARIHALLVEHARAGRDVIGDDAGYITEGLAGIYVQVIDEQPVAIQLPASVVLTITYTEPGLQGDRSTGGTKPATLETGAEINVPLFINTGDKLKVDTRDGSYLGRVNS